MHSEPRPRRPIFYISDGTGITAETIGHSVLTQFEGVDFDAVRIPFVEPDPAQALAEFDYAHPVFDRAAIEAQRRLPQVLIPCSSSATHCSGLTCPCLPWAWCLHFSAPWCAYGG